MRRCHLHAADAPAEAAALDCIAICPKCEVHLLAAIRSDMHTAQAAMRLPSGRLVDDIARIGVMTCPPRWHGPVASCLGRREALKAVSALATPPPPRSLRHGCGPAHRARQGRLERPAVPAAPGERTGSTEQRARLRFQFSRSDHLVLLFCVLQLVLINISDHHTRTRANSEAGPGEELPVLGCLLGTQAGRTVDISNSFEMRYQEGSATDIDHAFLLKKMEQCGCLKAAARLTTAAGVLRITTHARVFFVTQTSRRSRSRTWSAGTQPVWKSQTTTCTSSARWVLAAGPATATQPAGPATRSGPSLPCLVATPSMCTAWSCSPPAHGGERVACLPAPGSEA